MAGFRAGSGQLPQVDAHVQQLFQELPGLDAVVDVVANEPFQVAARQGDVDVVQITGHG
jgi:hypothetical protein